MGEIQNVMNKINTSHLKIKTLYNPMRIAQIYLIGIIVLYILGPLEWRTENPFLFYMFLFSAQGLLYLGYSTTMKRLYLNNENDEQAVEEEKTLIIGHKAILKYLKVFIVINLILTCMYLMRNTGLSSFSISQIIDNFNKGLINANSQYLAKFDTEIGFWGRILTPIITLTSPLTWPVIPLSLVYYKELNLINKVLTVLTIFFEAARWVSTGTNKGIIDIILIFIAVILIKQWQKRYEISVNKTSKKRHSFRNLIIIISFLVIGFSVFGNNISSRLNENYDTVTLITGMTEVNLKAPLMIMSPQSLQPTMVYMTQYLTQGYYGLSLALDEPFVPMFGVGNSYFLIKKFQDLLSINIWQYTYQARITYKGWDPFVNWHSLYMWLANDVSFLGVLVLMYFFGKYFAVVTFKCIVYKDPIASALFCLILLCFFYLPCNNQILSSPITFMAFWGLNAFWFYRVLRKSERKRVGLQGGQ